MLRRIILVGCLALAWVSVMETAWPVNLGSFAGGKKTTVISPEAEPGFARGETWLNPFMARKSLDDLFAMMRTEIRFEPYAGMLRGPIGTAMARRGNSLDQAVLLKKVLDMQGYQTRLAEGAIGRKNALVLLGPWSKDYSWGAVFDPDLPSHQLQAAEIIVTAADGEPMESTIRNVDWQGIAALLGGTQ